MNARSIPSWLEPYKNQWLSAGKLKDMLLIEGRYFGPWFEEVKPRLKVIKEPSKNGMNLVSKYMVKHVWAFALAHGVKFMPNVLIAPPLPHADLLATIGELETRLTQEKNNFKYIKADTAPEHIELMRMLVAATEPKAAPGVYFLLDDLGHINYVGQSKNVLGRMAGHTGKTFSTVKMIKVADDKKRLEIESRFIGLFQPSANSTGIRAVRLIAA
jgi:hypothetical protein